MIVQHKIHREINVSTKDSQNLKYDKPYLFLLGFPLFLFDPNSSEAKMLQLCKYWPKFSGEIRNEKCSCQKTMFLHTLRNNLLYFR